DGQNATAASSAFTPTAAGVYRWRAAFDGDGNYQPVAAGCNAANESATVSPFVAPPPPPVAPPPPPPPAAVPPPPPPPGQPPPTTRSTGSDSAARAPT